MRILIENILNIIFFLLFYILIILIWIERILILIGLMAVIIFLSRIILSLFYGSWIYYSLIIIYIGGILVLLTYVSSSSLIGRIKEGTLYIIMFILCNRGLIFYFYSIIFIFRRNLYKVIRVEIILKNMILNLFIILFILIIVIIWIIKIVIQTYRFYRSYEYNIIFCIDVTNKVIY